MDENVSLCDETLMESYLESGEIDQDAVAELIRERKLFPCYFGSALKMQGVEEFLRGFEEYTREKIYPEEFGAKVFKIARDGQGNRPYLYEDHRGKPEGQGQSGLRRRRKKLWADASWAEGTGRVLGGEGGSDPPVFRGKYETLQEAPAGTVCAVTGLTRTYPGEGLGVEADSAMPVLEPVLSYQIRLPEGCDPHKMLQQLKQLEEEEPELHIVWDSALGEIHAQLMGEVQIEILKRLIWERFHVAVEFGAGNIVYKETIAAPVTGAGHFEPLRHYAEVYLLLEPGEPGSGCQYFTACSEDVLARNWQRLILTHLEEKEHPGVLTGSPITDIQITLLTGRAHTKHTEGRRFPPGDLPRGAAGAEKGEKYSSGAVLRVPAGASRRDAGESHGGYPENAGQLSAAGNGRRDSRAHRNGSGGGDAGLSEGDQFLYPGKGTSFL